MSVSGDLKDVWYAGHVQNLSRNVTSKYAMHVASLLADCFTMPHIVHAFAAAIAIAVFAVLAAAFSMGEMEVWSAGCHLYVNNAV
jgi:hypothetical protein